MSQRFDLRSGLVLMLFFIGVALFAWQGAKPISSELDRLRNQACLPLEPNSDFAEKPALDFTLKDYAGRAISLADYRGRVVFLNFWATWCPPCVAEMASMEELNAKLASHKDFVMLTVSEDKSWDDIRKFFKGGTKLTVLLDEDWKAAHAWGTQKLPETYLIGRDGTVKYHIVNERQWSSPQAVTCLKSLLD